MERVMQRPQGGEAFLVQRSGGQRKPGAKKGSV